MVSRSRRNTLLEANMDDSLSTTSLINSSENCTYHRIIGRKKELKQIINNIVKISRIDSVPIFIVGEKGVGKTHLIKTAVSLLSKNTDLLPLYFDVSDIKPSEINMEIASTINVSKLSSIERKIVCIFDELDHIHSPSIYLKRSLLPIIHRKDILCIVCIRDLSPLVSVFPKNLRYTSLYLDEYSEGALNTIVEEFSKRENLSLYSWHIHAIVRILYELGVSSVDVYFSMAKKCHYIIKKLGKSTMDIIYMSISDSIPDILREGFDIRDRHLRSLIEISVHAKRPFTYDELYEQYVKMNESPRGYSWFVKSLKKIGEIDLLKIHTITHTRGRKKVIYVTERGKLLRTLFNTG